MDGSQPGIGRSLRTIDPLAVAAREELVLPDRHRRLQLVDQRVAGGKRDIAVRGPDGRDHREVADLQVAGPVRDGERQDRVAGGDLLRDPAELGRRRRGGRCRTGPSRRGRGHGRAPRRRTARWRPPPGSAAAARTSSTDSGSARTSVILTTVTLPSYRHRAQRPAQAVRTRAACRRTWRTMAAVPMTATVAPAAVIVASFLSSRRPATAWWPARWSSSTSSASALS